MARAATAAVHRPDKRGVLDFDTIISVSTSADLRALYARNGLKFATQAELLAQVKHDWARECVRWREANRSPEIPVLEVAVDGQRYSIVGIAHSNSAMGRSYFDQVTAAMRTNVAWYSEQELASYTPQRDVHEMYDHRVLSFADGLGLGFEISGAPLMARWFRKAWDVVSGAPAHMLVSQRAHVLRSHPHMSYGDCDLPPFIRLEAKVAGGRGLTGSEKRSAYMAEVLRLVGRSSGDCGIVVGFAHAAEVEYFLRHPTTDQRVLELAAAHAAVVREKGKLEPLSIVQDQGIAGVAIGFVTGQVAFASAACAALSAPTSLLVGVISMF